MSKTVKTYGEVLTFFVLEALAFTSFTLGNSPSYYCLFGLLTLLMIVIFNYERLKELDWTYYLIFLIPFVIFAALSGFSYFTLVSDFRYPIGLNMFVCLGLLVFLSLGFLTKIVEKFKMINAMMVIYGGIAIILAIGFVYAMIRFKPFYTMIYEGYYIYYEGQRLPIWEMVPFLMEVNFKDVSIQYFQLFATLLFTSVVALRYINPKKETRKFIIFLIYALFGFIAMIFTINKVNIVTGCLVGAYLLFLLFIPKKGKVLKPIAYTIAGLVGVFCIMFFLNAQSTWGPFKGYQNLIASNSFLDKVFNSNRYSAGMKEMLDGAFTMDKLFGYNADKYFHATNCFLVDNISTTGFVGAVAFFVFLVFAGMNLCKYYSKSKDDMITKTLVCGFIGSFFLYSLFALDAQPYTHHRNFIPMQHNAMFFITLFLIGYTMMDKNTLAGKFLEENIVIADDKKDDAETKKETVSPTNEEVKGNTIEPLVVEAEVIDTSPNEETAIKEIKEEENNGKETK